MWSTGVPHSTVLFTETPDRLPRFCDRRIHRHAIRQRLVQRARELHCRQVADLVLHCDHRGHAAADQNRGGAGEDVAVAPLGAQARVEHHHPERLVVGEQAAQLSGAQQRRLALIIGQGNDALL